MRNSRTLTAVRSSAVVFLAFALNAWAQVQGPHTSNGYNLFIDPAEMMPGNCTPSNAPTFAACEALLEQETIAYYKAIGVFQAQGNKVGTANRGTFGAWKTTFGFAADPNAPVADEIRATYFNNGDLQFARDMHCRAQTNTRPLGHVNVVQSITYACYVSNFSTSGIPGPTADPVGSVNLAVVSNPHPAATVVMEVSAAPQLAALRNRFQGGQQKIHGSAMRYGDVRFFAYDANDQPLIAAALDSEGAKALPGLCIACHGGGYISSQGGSATPRVTSGNFLPFDTSTFLYGTAANLTLAAQQDSFRRLNQFVESTKPVRQTIVDLIDGWYQWCGGVGPSGCHIDDVLHPFIPGDPSSCASGSTTCLATCPAANVADRDRYSCGWATGSPVTPSLYTNPPFDTRAFYQQVVAKECRTCHVALGDRFNVDNYAVWMANIGLVENDVFGIDRMPYGQVPFVDFWSGKPGPNQESARDFMRAFIATAHPTPHEQCVQPCGAAHQQCLNNCATAETQCLTSTHSKSDELECRKDFRTCAGPCNSAQTQCTNHNQQCPPF